VTACPLTLFNPLGRVFRMGNFGLRRQAERDAALEKNRTLIHLAKALSSLRFASAVQMCHPCLATWPGGIRGITNNGRTQAACDLSHLGSGEKDLPAAKAERPTERARWSQFQQITLKVLRWEERDKRLVIKETELVA